MAGAWYSPYSQKLSLEKVKTSFFVHKCTMNRTDIESRVH